MPQIILYRYAADNTAYYTYCTDMLQIITYRRRSCHQYLYIHHHNQLLLLGDTHRYLHKSEQIQLEKFFICFMCSDRHAKYDIHTVLILDIQQHLHMCTCIIELYSHIANILSAIFLQIYCSTSGDVHTNASLPNKLKSWSAYTLMTSLVIDAFSVNTASIIFMTFINVYKQQII